MLQVLKSGVVVQEYTKEITIAAFGQSMLSFSLETDFKKGDYTIEVFLFNTPFGTVKSIRNFKI
jgi:hypothetical protein